MEMQLDRLGLLVAKSQARKESAISKTNQNKHSDLDISITFLCVTNRTTYPRFVLAHMPGMQGGEKRRDRSIRSRECALA